MKRMPAEAACVGALLYLFSVLAQAAGSSAAHIEAALPKARLAGEGSYRWFGLKIYDAQLWVGEQATLPMAANPAPFALDLRYARNLHGAKIAQASLDEIKKLGIGTTEQRNAWLIKMQQLFPDVHENSHITGVFFPHRTVHFYNDGALLGEIADGAFADAFAAIWFDPKTSAASLRAALLGGAVAQ